MAANLIQVMEDEGPDLMMAYVETLQEGMTTEGARVFTMTLVQAESHARMGGHVFLNEVKAVITPSCTNEKRGEV